MVIWEMCNKGVKSNGMIYPDPITPRADPDLLAHVDYDPFLVMSESFPESPRVFATSAQISRARDRLEGGEAVAMMGSEELLTACKLDEALPELEPAGKNPDWGGPLVPWLSNSFVNALAWSISGKAAHLERALLALRQAAQACEKQDSWTGYEHHEGQTAARAYDLLVSSGLSAEDDRRFRGMLRVLLDVMGTGAHYYCNNHNAMGMVARLSMALALGDRQAVHDVLYGFAPGGVWRYGLIHLMRHDFLSDGMQWEGSPGYHMLVVGMVFECFTMLDNSGVDLWHRDWPSTQQDDGFDEHRGWGPKGTKHLCHALNALIYQCFSNGDYSLLHDQGLGNLRGAQAWWKIYLKALELYGDPRYAWVLKHINHGKAVSRQGPVPVWFERGGGPGEFVRFEPRELPDGQHPLEQDVDFSLTGRHIGGCSLFPAHGSVLLRSQPMDPNSLGAYVYWGPHWAGHRSPASLHLDIHGLGRRISTAPHLFEDGYADPRHLSWHRTTIAHNTVTLDEKTMFPFDFDAESPWECDHWRDSLSDSRLERFQPTGDFKAIRVSNDNVYPGAVLDRTVVPPRDYLLDVYRVTAEATRQMDWAMHCHGNIVVPSDSKKADLGSGKGYQHLTEAQTLARDGDRTELTFDLDSNPVHATIWMAGIEGSQLILARDPEPDQRRPIGDAHLPESLTAVIVRGHGEAGLFVSIWGVGERSSDLVAVTGSAETDVTVEISSHGETETWCLPGIRNAPIEREVAG